MKLKEIKKKKTTLHTKYRREKESGKGKQCKMAIHEKVSFGFKI